LVRDNGDGSFSARLYDRDDLNGNGSTGWEWFTFSGNILGNGYNMAELSGDFDGPGEYGSNTGFVEIWPNLLEKAWAALKGGYGAIVGGNTATDAWLALTGTAGVPVPVTGWTNAAIRDRIIEELDAGNQVSIGTFDATNKDEPLVILPDGKQVYGDHSYVVLEALDPQGDGVFELLRIYNPWGAGRGFDLPDTYLTQIAAELYILNKN
jgi:hypothetical protein